MYTYSQTVALKDFAVKDHVGSSTTSLMLSVFERQHLTYVHGRWHYTVCGARCKIPYSVFSVVEGYRALLAPLRTPLEAVKLALYPP